MPLVKDGMLNHPSAWLLICHSSTTIQANLEWNTEPELLASLNHQWATLGRITTPRGIIQIAGFGTSL